MKVARECAVEILILNNFPKYPHRLSLIEIQPIITKHIAIAVSQLERRIKDVERQRSDLLEKVANLGQANNVVSVHRLADKLVKEHHINAEFSERLHATESRLTMARGALKKYGGHDPECGITRPYSDEYPEWKDIAGKCTCGFEKALTDTE